jgi:DegV family protein with EDD domain
MMKFFRKIKENFLNYLYDSSIDMKDRTFVLFSFAEMFALLVNVLYGFFLLEEQLVPTIATLVFVIFGAVVILKLMKKKDLKRARIILALLLVFVMRPAMFFAKGGIRNGTLIMFLMGAYYLVIVLDGKFRVFMILADTAITISLSVLAYYRPDLVTEYSRANEFKASVMNYMAGFFVLTIIITFWVKILQREAQIAEEKTKEAEELNKSQNRFFSSMSHEIRTPINTVLGLNEIILRQPDASEEIKKDAQNIQGAGKMLLALINDILDISKIEAGKMDVVPVDYDVKSLLSEIVNMIWLKAQDKGLEFRVGIDPNVPQKLYGDEVRIKQILINLLNNAVKYTPKGFVSLYMECEPSGEDKVLLKINVTDSGMGIKADALPHLFDTFQRQDEEKNRYIEGTGLGLSIVKQLVELMDGAINVNSVYTEGTTFLVEVKQGVSSTETVGDINVFASSGITGDDHFEHSFHAPEGRILIVDDNEMNLMVESKLLDGTDLTVDLSDSGADALTRTLKETYDVIFMDHLMPGMDGIECFEKIRWQTGGLNQHTPIIALTANAGGENIELYHNTGFDGYLVKPVSGKQLEDLLISFLPVEKVILAQQNEITGAALSTARGYVKKRQVVIATDTMCDLPRSLIRDLQISIIPVGVRTTEGLFHDTWDVDSNELLRYMEDETKTVQSVPPSREAFIQFFASELKKAHHLIFIAHSSVSAEFANAMEAAKTFENVTVINTRNTSSAVGVLAMIAARFAQQNMQPEEITAEINAAIRRLRCRFVIKNTNFLARRQLIKPWINSVLNTLWLRPVLQMKDDRFGVSQFLFGNDRKCHAKFISDTLSAKHHPQTDFVIVTYAGIDSTELEWIRERILAAVPFRHVIFQKASAGFISNTGPGTFGLTFLLEGGRPYHLAGLMPKEEARAEADKEEADAAYEVLDEEKLIDDVAEDVTAADDDTGSAGDDTPSEPKWYEQIPGIDTAAAVKNSGSEDSFLSVIKIFYDSYPAKKEELERFYDTGDWENYTVKIHALKSSARLVGALTLGDAAEKLEMAGKGNDLAYIQANHASAMTQYTKIRESLSSEFGPKENPDLPQIDAGTLAELYEGLGEFAYAKDLELARMVIGNAAEYRLPPEDAERFKRLQARVEQKDWDGICDIIKEVSGT